MRWLDASAYPAWAELLALDRFYEGEREGPAEPLTPEFVGRATDAQLAASLRRARDADERPKRKARLRAAGFIADFGAAHGLPRVATPASDALLAAFYARLDRIPDSRAAFADAFAPYRELFTNTPWDAEAPAPTVRLCAAAAEVPYETIGKTVEALELEVFGVAAVAPAAATTPADKKKRKRAVKRDRRGLRRRRAAEAKTFTAEELAQQRYDKAKADGDVVELSHTITMKTSAARTILAICLAAFAPTSAKEISPMTKAESYVVANDLLARRRAGIGPP
ncbi:amino acid transmembrane transporter [Aureococcus anophagefferens]|nr:amino acid transmembrane transporter [Aureococcus anophagefferens]